ncbi:MAG: hypothetical protein V4671_12275 [Armatimonadota bacterium]
MNLFYANSPGLILVFTDETFPPPENVQSFKATYLAKTGVGITDANPLDRAIRVLGTFRVAKLATEEAEKQSRELRPHCLPLDADNATTQPVSIRDSAFGNPIPDSAGGR